MTMKNSRKLKERVKSYKYLFPLFSILALVGCATGSPLSDRVDPLRLSPGSYKSKTGSSFSISENKELSIKLSLPCEDSYIRYDELRSNLRQSVPELTRTNFSVSSVGSLSSGTSLNFNFFGSGKSKHYNCSAPVKFDLND